jgi:hypothetical protein
MTISNSDFKPRDPISYSSAETPELMEKLKSCDSDIQQYISELEAEIKQLHKKNISMQGKNKSLDIKIKAFEEHYSDCDDCELKLIKDAEEKANNILHGKPQS